MNLFEKKMIDVKEEAARKQKCLIAARGRIAEAEALAAEICAAVGEREYMRSAVGCITAHDSGEIDVRVLILDNHGQVRKSLRSMCLSVVSEGPSYPGSNVTSIITLQGFDVEIHMYMEPEAVLKEAA